jgi:tetratricopeptide (TPR) repeat protein
MDTEAMYEQAMADIAAGQHENAQRLLNQVIKKNPSHEQAWLGLALIVPEMDQAIECLNRVLELNPGNVEAFDYLNMARQEKKRDEAARAAAQSSSPQGSADGRTGMPRLGNYLLEAKLVTHAELQAALAVQRRGDAAGQPKRLGQILVEQGVITARQLDEAVRKQIEQFNTWFRD